MDVFLGWLWDAFRYGHDAKWGQGRNLLIGIPPRMSRGAFMSIGDLGPLRFAGRGAGGRSIKDSVGHGPSAREPELAVASLPISLW